LFCWLEPTINQAYYNGPSVVNDKFAIYYNEPLTPFWLAFILHGLINDRIAPEAAYVDAA